jgi:N-sulfoglucosamine sulfohydrolase
MSSDRPNILYIHSHDTGRYVQPYGHAVPTPRLQQFAEEGVLFRQAFCANPTCSPSRASLLTGQYPHNNGMVGLAHRGFALNDYRQHIIHTLREAGYTSALAGMQHIAHPKDTAAQTIGYDRYLGEPATAHERAAAFLADHPPPPFFLSVGFHETHREYPATPDDNPAYCLPPAPLPDTPATREDMARFKASARILDRKIGAVLDALERSGLAGHTLVICTTDHGIAFPRMKCTLTDSGIGVMLIVRGPGGFAGGKVVDAMVSHLDLFPTVCQLAGVDVPERAQGKSLLPLVAGEAAAIHDEIFAEVNYHAAYEPQRGVRTPRWKYIRRFEQRTSPVLPNCDDGLSKDVWLAHGWRDNPPPDEALYDLVFDPNESANLAGDARHAAVLDEMRGRLVRWMRQTGDPLLKHGFVPAPEGAIVNDPDDVTPNGPVAPVPPRPMDRG